MPRGMWIRRSEEEIQKYMNAEEAKRKSLLRPLLFALVLTVVTLILYVVGYRGGSLRMGIVMLEPFAFFTWTEDAKQVET